MKRVAIFTLSDYHFCLFFFARRSTMAFVADRYIRASELRTFSFLAGALGSSNAKASFSALQSARTFGTTDHQQHRQAAAHATASGSRLLGSTDSGAVAWLSLPGGGSDDLARGGRPRVDSWCVAPSVVRSPDGGRAEPLRGCTLLRRRYDCRCSRV